MSTINTKRLIIVAGIILVVLVAMTIFINSLTNKTQTSQQPTLIPTGIFESEGNSQNKALIYEGVENDNAMTEEEVGKLEELKSKAPVDTADFTLGYPSDLGEFFVETKNSQGEEKFKQYLSDNGLSNVYNNLPEFFHISSQSLNQLINQRELQAQNAQTAAEQQIQKSMTQQQKQASKTNRVEHQQALFFDFVKTLLAFDLGTNTVGNTSPTGGSGNLPTGQPYNGSGTPQLKRIMSVIKAIPGLSWGGICANPAAGGHIPNSEHYHCNAVDVLGSETILDNAFADLLAAAKRDEIPIHCLIYERYIYSREYDWAKRPYSGPSNHDSHIHISGWPTVGGAC